MVIATFAPTTGWSGKTITFDDEVFTLQDHGPISAGDVLAYDNQGYLEWANDGMREWVEGLVSAPPAAPPIPQPATPQASAGSKASPQVQPLAVPAPLSLSGPAITASRKRGGAPLWVWAVIGGVVLAAGIGIFMLNRVDTSRLVFVGSGGGADTDSMWSDYNKLNTGHLRATISWSQSNDSPNPLVMFYVEDVKGEQVWVFDFDPKKGSPQSEDFQLPEGDYRAGVLSRDAKWSVELRQM